MNNKTTEQHPIFADLCLTLTEPAVAYGEPPNDVELHLLARGQLTEQRRLEVLTHIDNDERLFNQWIVQWESGFEHNDSSQVEFNNKINRINGWKAIEEGVQLLMARLLRPSWQQGIGIASLALCAVILFQWMDGSDLLDSSSDVLISNHGEPLPEYAAMMQKDALLLKMIRQYCNSELDDEMLLTNWNDWTMKNEVSKEMNNLININLFCDSLKR